MMVWVAMEKRATVSKEHATAQVWETEIAMLRHDVLRARTALRRHNERAHSINERYLNTIREHEAELNRLRMEERRARLHEELRHELELEISRLRQEGDFWYSEYMAQRQLRRREREDGVAVGQRHFPPPLDIVVGEDAHTPDWSLCPITMDVMREPVCT